MLKYQPSAHEAPSSLRYLHIISPTSEVATRTRRFFKKHALVAPAVGRYLFFLSRYLIESSPPNVHRWSDILLQLLSSTVRFLVPHYWPAHESALCLGPRARGAPHNCPSCFDYPVYGRASPPSVHELNLQALHIPRLSRYKGSNSGRNGPRLRTQTAHSPPSCIYPNH